MPLSEWQHRAAPVFDIARLISVLVQRPECRLGNCAASAYDCLVMTGDKVSEMLQAPPLLHRRKPDDGLSRDDGRSPRLRFDERCRGLDRLMV